MRNLCHRPTGNPALPLPSKSYVERMPTIEAAIFRCLSLCHASLHSIASVASTPRAEASAGLPYKNLSGNASFLSMPRSKAAVYILLMQIVGVHGDISAVEAPISTSPLISKVFQLDPA